MKRLVLLFVLASVCDGRISNDVAAQPRNVGRNPEYKRVCYYTNWSQYRKQPGRFFPFNIDPFLCTHLIFAFSKVDYNGHLAPYEWNDIQYPHLYRQFTGLKKKNPHLRTLLAVGGWTHGSRPFTDMVKTKIGRQSFIDHAIQYLRTHNFDGLDLDWEYPANRGSPKEDKKMFSTLVMELKNAFVDEASRTGKERLLLAAAVAAGIKISESAYEVPIINKYLDFINLMSYDLHGSWSKTLGINAPLYPDPNNQDPKGGESVDDVVKHWLRLGATRDKLVMGIAMYGRSFTLCSEKLVNMGDKNCGAGKPAPFTREKGFISYYEMKTNLKKGWARVWSQSQMVPFAYSLKEKQWVGYDDVQSVQIKAQYIKQNKLAGAMLWSIDLDDFANIATKGEVYPLSRAIREVLEDADYPQFKPPPKISPSKRRPQFKLKSTVLNDGSKQPKKSSKSQSPFAPPRSPYSPPKSLKKKPVSKTYLSRAGSPEERVKVEGTESPHSKTAAVQSDGPVIGKLATPKYYKKSSQSWRESTSVRSTDNYTPSTSTSTSTSTGYYKKPTKSWRDSTPDTSTDKYTPSTSRSTSTSKSQDTMPPISTRKSHQPKSTKPNLKSLHVKSTGKYEANSRPVFNAANVQSFISTSTDKKSVSELKEKITTIATEAFLVTDKHRSNTRQNVVRTTPLNQSDKQYPKSPYNPPDTVNDVRTEATSKTTGSVQVPTVKGWGSSSFDFKSKDETLSSLNLKESKLHPDLKEHAVKRNNLKSLRTTSPRVVIEERVKIPKSPYKPYVIATSGVIDATTKGRRDPSKEQYRTEASKIKTSGNKISQSNESWKSLSFDANSKDKHLTSMDLKQKQNLEGSGIKANRSPYTKPPHVKIQDTTLSGQRVIRPTAASQEPSEKIPQKPSYHIVTSPYKPWTRKSIVTPRYVVTDSPKRDGVSTAYRSATSPYKPWTRRSIITPSAQVVTDSLKLDEVSAFSKSATSPYKPWKTTVYRKYIRPTEASTMRSRESMKTISDVKNKRKPIVDVYGVHSKTATDESQGKISKPSTTVSLTDLSSLRTTTAGYYKKVTTEVHSKFSTTRSLTYAGHAGEVVGSTRPFFLFAKNRTYPTQKAAYPATRKNKIYSTSYFTSPPTVRTRATTQNKLKVRTTDADLKHPTTRMTTLRHRTITSQTTGTSARPTTLRHRKSTSQMTDPSTQSTTRIPAQFSTSWISRSPPRSSKTKRVTSTESQTTRTIVRPTSGILTKSTIGNPNKSARKTRKTTTASTSQATEAATERTKLRKSQIPGTSTPQATSIDGTLISPSTRRATKIVTIKTTEGGKSKRKSQVTYRQMTSFVTVTPKRTYRPSKLSKNVSTKSNYHALKVTTAPEKRTYRPIKPKTKQLKIAHHPSSTKPTKRTHRPIKPSTAVPQKRTYRPIKRTTTLPQKRTTVQHTTNIPKLSTAHAASLGNTPRSKVPSTVIIKESRDASWTARSPESDYRKIITPKPTPSQGTKTYWVRTRPTGPQRIFAWMTEYTTTQSTENTTKMMTPSTHSMTSTKPTTAGVTDSLPGDHPKHWSMQAILGDDYIHPLKSALFGINLTKRPPSVSRKHHTAASADSPTGWSLEWLHMITSKPTYKPLLRTRIPYVLGPVHRTFKPEPKTTKRTKATTPDYQRLNIQSPSYKKKKQTAKPVYWKKSIYTPSYRRVTPRTTFTPGFRNWKIGATEGPTSVIHERHRHGLKNSIIYSQKYKIVKEKDELAVASEADDIPADTISTTAAPECMTSSNDKQYDYRSNEDVDYPLYEEYSDYYDSGKELDYQQHSQIVNNDYPDPLLKKDIYDENFKGGYQEKVKLTNNDYFYQDVRPVHYQSEDYVIRGDSAKTRNVIGQDSYPDSEASPHRDVNGYTVPEFNCPSVFGIFPDPLDCRQFYQCVWFVPFHHMCGIGTVWNQQMKICDWPGAVTCRT